MRADAGAPVAAQVGFAGQWTAQYWDGSAPLDVRLRVDVSAAGATAIVEWPGRAAYRASAAHLADAQVLYMPGIEARLNGNLLHVEFTDYGPAPAPMTMSFKRP